MPASVRGLCDYSGPVCLIQHNTPISGSLITSANFLLLCKIAYPQVLGIRTWTSLGAIIRPLSQLVFVVPIVGYLDCIQFGAMMISLKYMFVYLDFPLFHNMTLKINVQVCVSRKKWHGHPVYLLSKYVVTL